jgi:hypothetical protein
MALAWEDRQESTAPAAGDSTVYDMYSWDKPAAPDDEHRDPQPAREDDEPAARAVQVALDRRDNGGEANPGRPA